MARPTAAKLQTTDSKQITISPISPPKTASATHNPLFFDFCQFLHFRLPTLIHTKFQNPLKKHPDSVPKIRLNLRPQTTPPPPSSQHLAHRAPIPLYLRRSSEEAPKKLRSNSAVVMPPHYDPKSAISDATPPHFRRSTTGAPHQVPYPSHMFRIISVNVLQPIDFWICLRMGTKVELLRSRRTAWASLGWTTS